VTRTALVPHAFTSRIFAREVLIESPGQHIPNVVREGAATRPPLPPPQLPVLVIASNGRANHAAQLPCSSLSCRPPVVDAWRVAGWHTPPWSATEASRCRNYGWLENLHRDEGGLSARPGGISLGWAVHPGHRADMSPRRTRASYSPCTECLDRRLARPPPAAAWSRCGTHFCRATRVYGADDRIRLGVGSV